MGTYPRSYGYRVNWGSLLTPAVKALLIANTAVFLVEAVSPEGVYKWMLLSLGLVPRGVFPGLRIWQPFTYLFLHGGFMHLFFNMLALWMFGCDLERVWGTRRFLNYYFITGAGAGVLNVVVKTVTDPHGTGGSLIPTIGASGAIYGILMAAAILFPDRHVYMIFPPVALPMRVYVFIMGAMAFFGSIGAPGDTVSHISHLGGMLVGYVYLRRGSLFFGLRNQFLDWKRRRMRRKFDVYMHEHRDEPPSRPDRWVN